MYLSVMYPRNNTQYTIRNHVITYLPTYIILSSEYWMRRWKINWKLSLKYVLYTVTAAAAARRGVRARGVLVNTRHRAEVEIEFRDDRNGSSLWPSWCARRDDDEGGGWKYIINMHAARVNLENGFSREGVSANR